MNKLKGIDLPFQFNEKGYPAASVDNKTLHDMIYTILNTTPGERVMRPTYGCWLKRLVFDNISIITAVQAEVEIKRALREWEPRISVTNVLLETDSDNGQIIVNISWVASGEENITVFAVSAR